MRRRPSYRQLPCSSASPRTGLLRVVLAFALIAALLPALPVLGLVSATISIDGVMDDWAGILASPENAMSDPIGAADPDRPGTQNRDLNLMAYTWDTDNLYLFIQRTASGDNSVHYLAYIDVNGDGAMSGVDRIADFDFNGVQFQEGASGVYEYAPANGSDALGGDGYDMPGTLGAPVPGALSAASASDGIRHELAIPWTLLGVSDGSPINLKIACSLNTNLPIGIQDNAGIGSLVNKAATLSMGTTRGGLAGDLVTFPHTVTNTGNVADTYALAAVSSRGWPTTVTGTAGNPLPSINLAPGASATFYVRVRIPSGTPDDVKDAVTITATGTGGRPSVSVTDHCVAGQVIVIPDMVNSIAPGNVSVFRNTLMNNTDEAITVLLSATSNKAYPVQILAADGVTPLSELVLPPGVAVPVLVHVAIPADALIGKTDITTLRAIDPADPTVRTSGCDTTNVRPPLELVPNNSAAAGPGTQVTYLHTVTNSTPDTRTVSLSAVSGWPAQILAADGITHIASVTLTPFGGSAQVRVRVSVPAGTAFGTTSVCTLTAASDALTATVTDTTTVSALVLYDDTGYGHRTDDFLVGETVYAQGSGLPNGATVRFRWLNPSGTAVFTSADIPVDVNLHALASYPLPATGPPGTWTCVILGTKNAELARRPFYVGCRGQIVSVSAQDVQGTANPVRANTTVKNTGASAISGTSLVSLVWYDVDTDGVLSNGDLWLSSAGAVNTYAGTGTESTHVSSGFTVAGGTTWSEPVWLVTSANLPYPGTYHLTAEWRTTDGHLIDVRDTTFEANVYRLTLTISDDAIDAGSVSPGVAVSLPPVSVSVESNTAFDLYKEVGGQAIEMGLSTGLGTQMNQASGLQVYMDALSLTVPWDTEPGPLQATLTYTVVAQ